MHPVLIYTAIFIATTVGLLFVFDKYHLGSIYLLLLVASVITFILGKLLIRIFPSEDPMQEEIKKDDLKVRANQYRHEIQFIFNIVQPDPKFQPNPKRIADCLDDCFDLDEIVLKQRLQQYFGDSFNINISQPLPDMIEEIKAQYKNWV